MKSIKKKYLQLEKGDSMKSGNTINMNKDNILRIFIGIAICMLLVTGSALGAGFRVPVTIGAAGFERLDKPVDVNVNFTQLLDGIGRTGTIDENSIHVSETNSLWTVIDASVPSQFDKDAGFNPTSKASGTVVFIMEGTTLPSASRYYYIYFDLVGGSSSPVVTSPQITLTDGIVDQGQSSYKVSAIDSTYFFQKEAGGFSSWNDKNGNDWIGWNTANASAGKYRGIPNAVNPEEVFHPGSNCCTSTIVSQGPIKIRVKSVNGTKWESFWDFYPEYATMTMTKVDHNYWFLYEGTPGGTLEINKDFMYKSNGVKTYLNISWLSDIAQDEWVYFSDPSTGGSGRSLFVIHHEDDTEYDQYWSHTYMTVFGFGRKEQNLTKLLATVPQHFTIGLVDGTNFAQNSKLINSIYKDVTITEGAAEQDNGDVGPLSIISSLPTSNPNTATDISQTFTVNTNKNTNIQWSIDGSVMQTDSNVSTSSYNNVESVGTHNVNVTAKNGTETVSDGWTWAVSENVVTNIQVTHSVGDDRQPMWSPDGQWLTFMTRNAGWQIRKIRLDGSSLTTLAGGAGGIEPAWGVTNKIAFSRGTSDPTMNVYVMNDDGTNVQTLVGTPEYDEYPDWNQDATKIAFVSQWSVPGGTKYISVMNADGTNKKNLGIAGIQPAWSPDGTKIVYKCYLGGTNICIVNADGTNDKQITFNTANTHNPDWSPDGSKVAYASSQDGDWEIYTINVDGTGKKQLTSNVGFEDNYPAWSPDGKYIAYASNSSGDQEIWIMSVDGQNIPQPLSITSSSPTTNPNTEINTVQEFNITLNKNADVTWYFDGSGVKTDTGVTTSSYSSSTAGVGTHVVIATAKNGTDSISKEWSWNVSSWVVQNLAVVSSLPVSNPSTIIGTPQTFSVDLNKNADVIWYVDGNPVIQDLNVQTSSYSDIPDIGTYIIRVDATDGVDTVSKEWTWTVSPEQVTLSIVSSLPNNNPSTIVGISQTFSIDLNKSVDVAWYVDGNLVRQDANVQTSSFSDILNVGTYLVTATATDGVNTVSKEWTWTVSPEPITISIVSSSPTSNPSTIDGTSQTFSVNLNKIADITWYVDGNSVKQDLGVQTSSFSDTPNVGTYIVRVDATDGVNTVSKEWTWTVSPVPVVLSIVSSLPASNPSTTDGTAQTFSVNLNKIADITWYVDGNSVKQDPSVQTSSYDDTLSVGTYMITVDATDGVNTVSKEWTWTVNPQPVALSIIASLPDNDPSTIVGTSQTFNVSLSKNADVMWYINDNVVDQETNVQTSSYSDVPNVGKHKVTAVVTNGTETVSRVWNWTIADAPIIVYIPPAPTISSVTAGNFWVEYILQPGIGDNMTDGYNVDANGTITNKTTNNIVNIMTIPHGKVKIIAYAYNNSGGTSLTPVIQETQVTNNNPVQQEIGNISATVGVEVTFTVSATDADNDVITYNTSATKGKLDSVKGVYSWTPDSIDVGTHTWSYCSKDNYGGIACETITVTVESESQLGVNITDPKNNAGISFVNNVVQGKVTGTGVKSAILKVRNEANVVTGLYNLTLTGGKFSQRVEYSKSQRNTLELMATDSTDNISKSSITVSVSNNVLENVVQVNAGEPVTINAKNETGTEIIFVPNVTSLATFRLTADTNIAEIAKLNNATSVNGDTALGRTVDISVSGIDATSEADVQNVTISMYYSKKDLDMDGDGIVENGELDEGKMSLYWYDAVNNSWEKLTNGDPQWVMDSGIVKISGYNAGYAWIKTRHLSKFALAAGILQKTSNGGGNSGGGGGGGGSSSGGGGGGGAIGSGENYSNIDARERRDMYLHADMVSQYLFAIEKVPVTWINITANENTLEISTMVEVLKGTSSSVKTKAPGVVYKNLNIIIGMSKESISRYIKSTDVHFKVENSWFDENAVTIDDVKMVRWNGKKWETLETSETMIDESYTYFVTRINGFSSFAIVGLKQDEKDGKLSKKLGVVPTKSGTPTKIDNKPARSKADQTEGTKNTAGFETIAGIVAFGLVYMSWRNKR